MTDVRIEWAPNTHAENMPTTKLETPLSEFGILFTEKTKLETLPSINFFRRKA